MAALEAQPTEIKQFIETITEGWDDLDGNPMIELRALGFRPDHPSLQ